MEPIQNNRRFPDVVVLKICNEEIRIHDLQGAADFIGKYGGAWLDWDSAKSLVGLADVHADSMEALALALKIASTSDPRYAE
jgi:hypothetical protein